MQRTAFLLPLALTLTACPKPIPDDPQPADCKKPGQACAKNTHDGPPPIGKNSPPPR